MELEKLVKKYAARNALEHGSAETDAVVGKVFAEQPELKERAGEVVSTAEDVIDEVNGLSEGELESIIGEHEYEEAEKDEGLPELPDAEERDVVMRMAPFPSGMLHIGNARMAVLNDEYVKRNDGKLLLVIDDTAGSEEKKPIPEAYDAIPEDLDWLGVDYDEIIYKSDRLERFYEYGERFLREGWAYVCECGAETLRENREEGVACEHREQSADTNLEKWEDMLEGGYGEGEAAVRLKTDMEADDPAFRDRVLLRISELDHPRVGDRYRVWPMLEFSWAIDDHELGITHILRGKDLVMEDRMERFMWELLDWEEPEILHHGLLGIEGINLSTSTSRQKIDSGEHEGWEDPRTWSLRSLKKRGFDPEAIRNFVLEFGMSNNDVSVPVDTLYTENRKIIDEKADRYFFVEEPEELVIEDVPEKLEAEIPYHPEEDRGEREVPVKVKDGKAKVYVDSSDIEDGFLRLKDLCNVEVEGRRASFHSLDHTEALEREAPIVQWVPQDGKDCEVVMPDAEKIEGVCEPSVPEEVVQFVRFGFVNVTGTGEKVEAYYAHP
ncbi:MAG: glutamate--tRNA ligase [Candidatus Nanohaloarchaeota archaeon QJJ-7]|nr:glutamate--tRNA ligase [Candidatus Nanohaloarchaeota archaeon QJJ-7]